MIFQPLQKIRVVESTKKCKPGSLGYAVFQEQIGSYNMWSLDILFTRFGKKGKPRLELMKLSQHIVDIYSMDKAVVDILEAVKVDEGLYPRYTSRSYAALALDMIDTKIDQCPIGVKDIMDLPTHEFISYIVAHSLLLHRFIHGSSTVAVTLTTGGVLETASDIPIRDYPNKYLGYYILAGLKKDTRNKTKKYATRIDDYFSDFNSRMECIVKMRKNLSMIQNAYTEYLVGLTLTAETEKDRIKELMKYYSIRPKELANILKLNEDIKNNPYTTITYSKIGRATKKKTPARNARNPSPSEVEFSNN